MWSDISFWNFSNWNSAPWWAYVWGQRPCEEILPLRTHILRILVRQMIIVGSDSAPGVGDYIICALDVQTQIWPMTLWKMGQFCCYHRPAPIWSAVCRGTIYTCGKETASEESLRLPWNSALCCFWGSHSAIVRSWGKGALLQRQSKLLLVCNGRDTGRPTPGTCSQCQL